MRVGDPQELEDELLFDEDGSRISNEVVSSFLEGMANGRTDFPTGRDLASALGVLLLQAGLRQDPGWRVVDALERPKGVKYAALAPQVAAVQIRANRSIEEARARRRAQLE